MNKAYKYAYCLHYINIINVIIAYINSICTLKIQNNIEPIDIFISHFNATQDKSVLRLAQNIRKYRCF